MVRGPKKRKNGDHHLRVVFPTRLDYDHTDSENSGRPLAITLIRAFTYRNCPIFGRLGDEPERRAPGRAESGGPDD